MKSKAVFLLTILALLIFGAAFGPAESAVREENIRSQATNTVPQPVLEDNITKITDYAAGNQTIETRNPTFKEVKDFILKDTTSHNKFITNVYECRHFTTDVNNNAEALGIRCAFVLLCYQNGQHAVVGFDTTDRGMIYIEPQTDAAIEPVVGGTYQGEKIVEILISW
jgi:hypothetical protein